MKTLTLAMYLALMSGCATGGRDGQFARNVGTATEAETLEMAHRVLNMHQFEMERELGAPGIYLETRWRERLPFADEEALGVRMVQVRAIVRARPRGTGTALGVLYTVDMAVEQRVRLMTSTEWMQFTPTAEAKGYAAQIVADLKRHLEIGVRRYSP